MLERVHWSRVPLPGRQPFLSRLPWVLGVLGYAAALTVRPLGEFDLPWHLAWGRVLAATGTVPHVDPIAYTHTPVRYIGVLADLALYGTVRWGGERSLQVLGGLAGVALAAALLFSARRAPRGALLALPLALAGASPWICARPAAMTFVLSACVLGCIDVHRAEPATRHGRAALGVAAGLHAIWCNVHGGALVGVALLGAYAVHRALAGPLRTSIPRQGWLAGLTPPQDGVDAPAAGIAAALAGVCTLLNPWGAGYLRGPLDVAKIAQLALDWKATTPEFFWKTAPLAGGTLVLLLTALAIPTRKRADGVAGDAGASAWTLFDLSLLVLALLLMMRTRFVPLAIVLLAPLAAKRLEPLSGARAVALVGNALLLALGMVVFVNDGAEVAAGWRQEAFPERAVAFIRASQPRGHMFNFWPYGGFLAWRLGEDYPVFLDGRIGFVHDTDTVLEAAAAERDPRAFAKLAGEWSMEWAVCRAHPADPSCLPLGRDAAWSMVYVDDVAAVYVRRAGPNAQLASLGYRLLRHTTAPGELLGATLSGGVSAADLTSDAALVLAQAPDTARAWFVAGCAAVAVGDRRRLEEAASRLALLEPDTGLAEALRQAAPAPSH